MKIISLQVGQPKHLIDSTGKAYQSSIFRESVTGRIHLFKDHLTGDQVTNGKAHGGEEKAVNVYPGEHYSYWSESLKIPMPENGSFGENFTCEGWLETDACIGDIYQVGQAIIQVSQPRQPCATLARRWNIPDFIRIVNTSGRTGWYLRVLEEGGVQAGDEITLQNRPFPEWSVARANAIVMNPRADPSAARALADCPALSPAWVEMLTKALSS